MQSPMGRSSGKSNWPGSAAVEAGHSPLPAATVQSIRQNRVGIKGPLQTPIGGGWRSVNVSIRQALDLYVSLRPVKSLPGPSKSRYQDVDVVVVRENTEGLYSGREHEAVPGVVEALKIVTRKASERIVRYAFEYARANGRRKVTVSHKQSIMPLSEGLFLADGPGGGRGLPVHRGRVCRPRQPRHGAGPRPAPVRHHRARKPRR